MNTLEGLLKTAIENDAEILTIEYKHGFEEITAYSDGIGVTIETIKSNTKETESLFDQIRKFERESKLKIGNTEVLLTISSYENFGEVAYEIKILRSRSDAVH